MKTTTQKAAINRLNSCGINKTTIAYNYILNAIMHKDKHIRPVYTSGSGRFVSNQDHTNNIMTTLNKLKINATLTNDAPRGGLTGNLIIINTKIK